MTFVAPNLLWLLAAAPLLVWLYVYVQRRPKLGVPRYASVDLVKGALGRGHRIRRHIPPALFLLAMIAIVVGVARPSASVTLPHQRQTIVLAMDVSLSMRASDVEPDRITAAQAAAKAFVEEQPGNVRLGIVSFGGTASVVQSPTLSKDELLAAIDRFQLQRGTATGSGLYLALATLFPDAGIDLESLIYGSSWNRGVRLNQERKAAEKATPKQPARAPVPPGSYNSGAIILLSDGRRTTGPDPLEAAKMAADLGVRVYTVGFGTLEGGSIGFGGWSAYVRLDEETLKAVADITKGEYFHAASGNDLRKVYQILNTKLVLEKQRTEITALFAGLAAILVALAGFLSLRWFTRG